MFVHLAVSHSQKTKRFQYTVSLKLRCLLQQGPDDWQMFDQGETHTHTHTHLEILYVSVSALPFLRSHHPKYHYTKTRTRHSLNWINRSDINNCKRKNVPFSFVIVWSMTTSSHNKWKLFLLLPFFFLRAGWASPARRRKSSHLCIRTDVSASAHILDLRSAVTITAYTWFWIPTLVIMAPFT